MQKPKLKNRIRLECKECLKNKRCKYKRTILFLENESKTNIDCWARKGIMSGLFGYHKTIYIKKKDGQIAIYFYHMINEKLDVSKDLFMRN
jgi:hypothetical protein